MQKRNRKLLSMSAAALILASTAAGLGTTVHAASDDDDSDIWTLNGANNLVSPNDFSQDESNSGSDILGFNHMNDDSDDSSADSNDYDDFFSNNDSNSDSSAKQTSNVDYSKELDLGNLLTGGTTDTNKSYNMSDLQTLIKQAESDTEKARVAKSSKTLQDQFNKALSVAKQAKDDKSANVAYKDLSQIMKAIDQDLKKDLKSALERTQTSEFKKAFNKISQTSDDSTLNTQRKLLKDTFMDMFNSAKETYADPMAAANTIKSATDNLNIYENLVMGAAGDSGALKQAKDEIAQQAKDLDGQQGSSVNGAASDLAKAMSTNTKADMMSSIADSVNALTKASEDRGLKYLIQDAESFMNTKAYQKMSNDAKLGFLTSLNNAIVTEQNPSATALMRAQAKSSLMESLSLARDGISPVDHLKKSIATAQALLKNKAFDKTQAGRGVQSALRRAEQALKNGTNAQKEAAANSLDDVILKGLASEVAALKQDNSNLKKQAAQAKKTSPKSNDSNGSGDNSGDSNGSSGDSNSGKSNDNSGSGSSDNGSGSDSGNSGDSSDNSGDSNGDNGSSNQSQPSQKRKSTGALPQTGRMIMQHMPLVAGIFAALAAGFSAWLYSDKKKAEKDSKEN